MRRLPDLKGKKIGYWRVLGPVQRGPFGQARWLVLCERCHYWWRVVDHSSLIMGMSQSCGCLKSDVSRRRMTAHGMTGTPTWISWRCMLSRCLNPRNSAFVRYGARGITVCQRWLKFENFLEDLGERPVGCTLDRIDPAGDYRPGNVRWADVQTQNNHLTSCRMITYQDRTQSLAMWARELGISYQRAYAWLVNQHLTIETVIGRLKSQSFSILRPA